MVDTGKVKDRRKLHYQSIDELLADVDRIVAADKSGTLRRTGNWTAGQAFGHLASWINYSYEGYPMKTPWFIRVILRFMKKKYLRNGMPAGVRIPGAAEGTYATQAMSTDQGAQQLRQALHRLKKGELSKFDSPAFGPMPLEERIALNLRHAELHLSFQHP
jgi:hypothetical protein